MDGQTPARVENGNDDDKQKKISILNAQTQRDLLSDLQHLDRKWESLRTGSQHVLRRPD